MSDNKFELTDEIHKASEESWQHKAAISLCGFLPKEILDSIYVIHTMIVWHHINLKLSLPQIEENELPTYRIAKEARLSLTSLMQLYHEKGLFTKENPNKETKQ
jgi:hypothetical protein